MLQSIQNASIVFMHETTLNFLLPIWPLVLFYNLVPHIHSFCTSYVVKATLLVQVRIHRMSTNPSIIKFDEYIKSFDLSSVRSIVKAIRERGEALDWSHIPILGGTPRNKDHLAVRVTQSVYRQNLFPVEANINQYQCGMSMYLSGTRNFMPTRSVFRGWCRCCLICAC